MCSDKPPFSLKMPESTLMTSVFSTSPLPSPQKKKKTPFSFPSTGRENKFPPLTKMLLSGSKRLGVRLHNGMFAKRQDCQKFRKLAALASRDAAAVDIKPPV